MSERPENDRPPVDGPNGDGPHGDGPHGDGPHGDGPHGDGPHGDGPHWVDPSAIDRLGLLRRAKTVALVGASDNPARASFFVATYLLSSTPYEVWFVNPRVREIQGRPVYDSLADLPGEPDIVSVFRKHSDLPGVLDEAVAAKARVLWLQLGLWHDEVAGRGTAAGLTVVMNRCLKIEHARFAGGLHLAGFNTGVISSRRQVTTSSQGRNHR